MGDVPVIGNGVGVECTGRVLRGIRLDTTADDGIGQAAEVGVRDFDDDRSLLDSLMRLRADLGSPRESARLATFLTTSTLQRFDVTGATGPELNDRRRSLEATHGIRSTVLVDDGPRRWMIAVRWDERQIRRLEELAERAGFLDVAIDPSPVALARVVGADVTTARRGASADEAFEMIRSGAITAVAGSVDPIAFQSPALATSSAAVPASWFDDLDEPTDLMAELARVTECAAWSSSPTLWIGARAYPPYPPHDLRAPERQCVALGAAVGAAGLAGRLRPVDVIVTPDTAAPRAVDERPWVIERLSDLPPREPARQPTGVNRLLARALPRRRPG